MPRGLGLPFRFAFTIKPLPPFSFELTARKPAGWPLFSRFEVWEKDTLWTALHIGDDLIGLKMHSTGTITKPGVSVEAFCARTLSAPEKKRLKGVLVTRLGTDTDLTEFYRMARKDSVLKYAARHLYGMRNTQFSSLFASATLAITLQMAPIKRSNQMQDCLIKRYGEAARFGGKSIPAWPTAKRIAKAGVQTLFKDCKLGYRAKFLVSLAQMIEGGFPSLEELMKLSPEEAKKEILKLPGIGDYSADIINPHGGFAIDVWSADIFGKLFFGEGAERGRQSIERIKAEGLKRWGGWARLAFLYIVHDLPGLSGKLGLRLRLQ